MSYKVAVLDCDSICFTIGNPKKIYEGGKPLMRRSNAGNLVYVTEEKTREELAQFADSTMSTILKNCNATHYIGWIKGQQTTGFRKAINPEYKANRPRQQPSWWAFVHVYLCEHWNVHEIDNIEVDDAVNITRLLTPDSFIVAIDNDLLGLVS